MNAIFNIIQLILVVFIMALPLLFLHTTNIMEQFPNITKILIYFYLIGLMICTTIISMLQSVANDIIKRLSVNKQSESNIVTKKDDQN